jgi:parallel beta-helix repeat protein
MKILQKLVTILIIIPGHFLFADIITIPTSYMTIQEGIDASQQGDTVLVTYGTYQEQLVISGKSITLTSIYFITGDSTDITKTIIDGNNGPYVISIDSSAGTETSIMGLTIQNGDDGIFPYALFNISNCIIRDCKDGIDYEGGSGGLCKNNTFVNNSDDGIDLDGDVDIIIENNKIINNNDDGIEIRLQPYIGITMNVIITNNIISGNEEDGIQFIDYNSLSDRIFYIKNNLIVNNAMAGVGCMGNAVTDETYEGASIPEPIFLISNTISNNNHGFTGGANVSAFNNIVANSVVLGMKNVNGNSLISFSNFWNNGQNFENCITDVQSLIFSDPFFISDSDYHILDKSACIRKGTPVDCPFSDIEYTDRGNPPDIGAYENISDGDQSLPGLVSLKYKRDTFNIPQFFSLEQNFPNPFNPTTTIEFALPYSSLVTLKIYNILGKEIITLVSEELTAGRHEYNWDATDMTSGIYFYHIKAGSFIDLKKMIFMK